MRKRERENPCEICGHYHNSEEGERCGVCGHRSGPVAGESPATLDPAFPTEVLKDFLFLGSYNNASRSEVLKTLNITHILNTVPDCQNLYRNSFTYHCIQDERSLDFDGANNFLEQCERETSRVLVHCMSGKNRSAAIVIGYLMKSRGWRLSQSYQWVKDRRPQVQLTDGAWRDVLSKILPPFHILHSISSLSMSRGFSDPMLVHLLNRQFQQNHLLLLDLVSQNRQVTSKRPYSTSSPCRPSSSESAQVIFLVILLLEQWRSTLLWTTMARQHQLQVITRWTAHSKS